LAVVTVVSFVVCLVTGPTVVVIIVHIPHAVIGVRRLVVRQVTTIE